MEPSRDESDQIVSTGERPDILRDLTEQPISPKDERIISKNPSPDAVIQGPSRDVFGQPKYSHAGGEFTSIHPPSSYAYEQTMAFAGFGHSTGAAWDGYSQFGNADGLHVVSPAMYNDSQSLVIQSAYGFNPEMAYGQYSPIATPLPSVMVDGQLYSPQQVPFSPSYYPQPAALSIPHVSSSAVPVSPTELMPPEASSMSNMLFQPGSGYIVNFGSFGGENLSANFGSGSITTPTAYPQQMGMLGSYEHNVGQVSQRRRPTDGFGLASRAFTRHPHYDSSYQSSNFHGAASNSNLASNEQYRFSLDKGRRRESDRSLISHFSGSHGLSYDRNRGPRASKAVKDASAQASSSDTGRNSLSSSGIHLDSFNRPDFNVEYENAKFFVIKSFSEDNVHKSIKYKVWASTPHGNKKLDAAYHEAKEIIANCPVFLFFSVNASGQFCGVAEMVGPVDFEKNADYWHQDRWSGQFPVQWHIIKDVPNIRFRQILLENNDNKPVTHSRDSQEVRLKQGVEMLKIFKDHDVSTSILDDFLFYDEMEKTMKERKAREQPSSTTHFSNSLSDDSVSQMSDSFSQSLQLNDVTKEAPTVDKGAISRTDASLSSVSRLPQILQSEHSNNEVPAPRNGIRAGSGIDN